jgi:hypothetical protein
VKRILAALAGLGAVLAAAVMMVVPAPAASAATLAQVTNFGFNPTNLGMYEYVPANVAPHPAILVAVHYCTGSGPAFFSGTQFASLADQFGFIVIYPSATRSGACFDVSTAQALTHNGSSDPAGIVSMVGYVETHNNGDASRVYVTGASSGAMMTDVLPLTGMAALAIQFFGLNSSTSTPPPTSPPPVTTTPPPATGGCQVTDDIVAWNTGLTSNLTITNSGSSAINGWSLVFTLPGGQAITSGWNANYAPASGQVTAGNLGYDAAIPPGGSVSVGFQASHTGNAAPPPVFSLNGATCG